MGDEVIFDNTIASALDSGAMSADEIAQNIQANDAPVGYGDSYSDVSYGNGYDTAGMDKLIASLSGNQDAQPQGTESTLAKQLTSVADKTGTTVKDLLAQLGKDKSTLAALITAGSGMLSGASKGKMQEKAWQRDDSIRAEKTAREDRLLADARARADAHAMPGAVATRNYASNKGTGLLEALK